MREFERKEQLLTTFPPHLPSSPPHPTPTQSDHTSAPALRESVQQAEARREEAVAQYIRVRALDILGALGYLLLWEGVLIVMVEAANVLAVATACFPLLATLLQTLIIIINRTKTQPSQTPTEQPQSNLDQAGSARVGQDVEAARVWREAGEAAAGRHPAGGGLPEGLLRA